MKIDSNVSFDLESTTKCSRCGRKFNKIQGNFYKTSSQMYAGSGFLPICNNCLNTIYMQYLSECGDWKSAVRQVCRALNLYWNEDCYKSALNAQSEKPIITRYLVKLRKQEYAGKCYDDTLYEEGTLWIFNPAASLPGSDAASSKTSEVIEEEDDEPPTVITKEIKQFWGKGYSGDTYRFFEERKNFYTDNYNAFNDNMGNDILMKQLIICEWALQQEMLDGKSPEKLVSQINNLCDSLGIKPSKLKNEAGGQFEQYTMSEWIRLFENNEPIVEPDPELQDPDKIKYYISVYFLGHLCKMLKIKNKFSKMYDEEMARWRVNQPGFDGDDEDFFEDYFNNYDAGSEDD